MHDCWLGSNRYFMFLCVVLIGTQIFASDIDMMDSETNHQMTLVTNDITAFPPELIFLIVVHLSQIEENEVIPFAISMIRQKYWKILNPEASEICLMLDLFKSFKNIDELKTQVTLKSVSALFFVNKSMSRFINGDGLDAVFDNVYQVNVERPQTWLDKRALAWATEKGSLFLAKLFCGCGFVVEQGPLFHDVGWAKCDDHDRINKRYEIIKWLLRQGADVNAGDHNGYRPIDRASISGDLPLVKILLEQKVETNTDRGRNGPLNWACQYKHYEVIECLLDRGFDINHCGTYDKSPLQLATENDDAKLVQLLTDRYAQCQVNPLSYDTPLLCAAEHNLVECLKILARVFPKELDAPRRWGITPLVAACCNGHKKAVEVLLDNGASIDKPVGKLLPIHHAAKRCKADIVKILANRGAKVEAKDWNGRTALSYAIESLDPRTVAALLELGASLFHEDNYKNTPIGAIIRDQYEDIYKVILEHLKKSISTQQAGFILDT